jgi:hypothetical protein
LQVLGNQNKKLLVSSNLVPDRGSSPAEFEVDVQKTKVEHYPWWLNDVTLGSSAVFEKRNRRKR